MVLLVSWIRSLQRMLLPIWLLVAWSTSLAISWFASLCSLLISQISTCWPDQLIKQLFVYQLHCISIVILNYWSLRWTPNASPHQIVWSQLVCFAAYSQCRSLSQRWSCISMAERNSTKSGVDYEAASIFKAIRTHGITLGSECLTVTRSWWKLLFLNFSLFPLWRIQLLIKSRSYFKLGKRASSELKWGFFVVTLGHAMCGTFVGLTWA